MFKKLYINEEIDEQKTKKKSMKTAIPLISFIFIHHGQPDWNIKNM